MRLDFYIPKLNIAIECQGRQHFEISKWYDSHNNENIILRQSRDYQKFILCKQHNIDIIYFCNYKKLANNMKFGEYITNVNDIKNILLSKIN